MDKRKIILDCDPGHDDAIAIMLAGLSPKLDLLGISVATGNQTLEKTARNAYNVSRYLGINVPVALGAKEPFIKKVETCPAIHGESGLDGFTFPKYDYVFDKRFGPQMIIDMCLANDKVTLIATGPLTNTALALKMNPDIKSHIEEIVVMGGSVDNGNVTPAAEFNIFCDPEAAYIVFNSGVKIKMVGLNVTRKVLVLPSIIDRLEKINNNCSKMFCDLMRVFNDNQYKTFGYMGAPLHDPVTVASIIDQDIVKYELMNVEIDISGQSSYGRTNCDVVNYLKKTPNCYVAMDVDVNKFWSLVEETMKRN